MKAFINKIFLLFLILPCTTIPMWKSVANAWESTVFWVTPGPELAAQNIEKAKSYLEQTYPKSGVTGTSNREGIVKDIHWAVTAQKKTADSDLVITVACNNEQTLAILRAKGII